MSDPTDDMVDAAAKLLGIPLDPAWKPEVKTQLEVILRHARTVAEFPLPEDIEPAPAFRA
jgi:hypothetical protein